MKTIFYKGRIQPNTCNLPSPLPKSACNRQAYLAPEEQQTSGLQHYRVACRIFSHELHYPLDRQHYHYRVKSCRNALFNYTSPPRRARRRPLLKHTFCRKKPSKGRERERKGAGEHRTFSPTTTWWNLGWLAAGAGAPLATVLYEVINETSPSLTQSLSPSLLPLRQTRQHGERELRGWLPNHCWLRSTRCQ